MSVQQAVRQYQDNQGLGVLEENQPNDLASFISANEPDAGGKMGFGVFVVRRNAQHPKRVAPISSGTSLILGATIKSQDVVPEYHQGIYTAGTANAVIPDFNYAEGQKVPVARMGYVSMLSASNQFQIDGDVYVKVALGTGTDDGLPLGAVNHDKGDATTGEYEKLPNAVFASEYESGEVLIAKVFFDLRLPAGSTTVAN